MDLGVGLPVLITGRGARGGLRTLVVGFLGVGA